MLFQDEDLALFLLDKHVKRITPQFFHLHGEAYWTVFVEYEEIIQKPSAKHMEKMTDTQKQLYKKLLEWRKEKARQEKVAVFIIAAGKELRTIALHPPATMEGLANIKGFGPRKVERHGKEILNICKAFQPDAKQDKSSPDTPKPKKKKSGDSPSHQKTPDGQVYEATGEKDQKQDLEKPADHPEPPQKKPGGEQGQLPMDEKP